MRHDEVADRQRRREIYRDQRVLDGAWAVVRVDGRGFSKLAREHFEMPFDPRFAALMHQSARALVTDFQARLAYAQSDEISVVLAPDWALFDRRVEKICSLMAALAAATFSVGMGEVVQFDARVWVGTTLDDVVEYMRWREADAARCALNTACYWALRREGMSARQATGALSAATVSDKNELLFERGQNFDALETWKKRGVLVHWQEYVKQGWDPVRQIHVEAARRRLVIDRDPPMKQAFGERVAALLDPARDPG